VPLPNRVEFRSELTLRLFNFKKEALVIASEKCIKGELAGYWEQGYEGRINYTFIPDENAEAINGGRGYFLKSDDFLRIFDENGVVIWEGEIKLVPVRTSALFFPDRHKLDNNIWATNKQQGVSYADWIGWFWSTPRMRAEFFRDISELCDTH
jgi:hypothetical protein